MLDVDLPRLRDIVAIDGDDVITKDGERIPAALFEMEIEMKKGYRVTELDEFQQPLQEIPIHPNQSDKQ